MKARITELIQHIKNLYATLDYVHAPNATQAKKALIILRCLGIDIFRMLLRLVFIKFVLDVIANVFGRQLGALVAIVVILAFTCLRIPYHKRQEEIEQRALSRTGMQETTFRKAINERPVIRKALFRVARELPTNLGIVLPKKESELELITSKFQIIGDNLVIHDLKLVKKKGSNIHPDEIEEGLQNAMTHMLSRGAFPWITQPYFNYYGVDFPSVAVYSVLVSEIYIFVSLVLVNIEYCKHKFAKDNARFMREQYGNRLNTQQNEKEKEN